MKKVGKISFWILLAIVSFGIIYYVYQVWWNDIDVRSVFAKGWNAAGIATQKATNYIKEKTGGTVSYVASGGVRYARNGAGNVVTSLGQSLESLGTEIIGIVPNSSSKISTSTLGFFPIGEATSSDVILFPNKNGFLLLPPFFSIATRVKQPIFFSLNRELSFKVSWGDNIEEEGTVPKDSSVVLSHIWERRGDYVVIFSITEKDVTQNFSFPVRIYE